MSISSNTETLIDFSAAISHIALPGTYTLKELIQTVPDQTVNDFKLILQDSLEDIYDMIVTEKGYIIPQAAKTLKANGTPVVRDVQAGTIGLVVMDSVVIISDTASSFDNYSMSDADYLKEREPRPGLFTGLFLFLKDLFKG